MAQEPILGKPFENLEDYYEIGPVLGKGQFGVASEVTERKTGRKLCCKTISKRKIPTEEDKADVRREISILWHLKGHPNVVAMHRAIEDRYNIHIIMEVCNGGELFDRIVARGHYSEKDAATMTRTILQVLHHMHTLGVMHRDLKPENFLLADDTDQALVKATDFGLSVFFRPEQHFSEIVGSAFYVAPEVLKCKYSKEADIWSVGVILYILLCGTPPFWDDTEQGIFNEILKAKIEPDLFNTAPWPKISDGAKECVKMMLTRDPTQRATAEKVMNHSWMKEDGSAPDVPLDNAVAERIKKFAGMNKLKKMALQVIAKSLSSSEIEGLKELFHSIDTDGSGTITFEELQESLEKQECTLPKGEIESMMREMDLDGDGTINYHEFVTATLNQAQLEKDDNMRKAFRYFDKDGNGTISLDELKEAAKEFSMSASDMEEVLKEVDTNGDGSIDYEEFLHMMTQLNERAGVPTPRRKIEAVF